MLLLLLRFGGGGLALRIVGVIGVNGRARGLRVGNVIGCGYSAGNRLEGISYGIW